MMQGKFRFSLDGVDATARQFSEIRRQLRELPASVGKSINRLEGRVAAVEDDFESLTTGGDRVYAGRSDAVVVPAHGGTGVQNVSDALLSSAPRKPVYCLYDGTLGSDCSSACSVANVNDADKVIPLDALRRVKWHLYWFNDDLNLKFDDAQPVIGLLAEDLDDAGLGFFCEYDDDDVPVGVDYPKLSMAALRLAQESMDEVDELRGTVESLSARIAKMEETYIKKSTVGE
nr:MAG: chaperone of endosialidase [Bacteriophage sp.]